MKNKIFVNVVMLLQLMAGIGAFVMLDSVKDYGIIILTSIYFVIGIFLWDRHNKSEFARKNKRLLDHGVYIYKLEELVWKQRLQISELEKDLKYYKVKRDTCNLKDCNGTLIPLPSINKKKCSQCQTEHEWHLDPGQKSTFIEGLTYDVEQKQISDSVTKKV